MASVGVFEAKNRLSELIERVGRGEEITITKRGEVVARLVQPQHTDTPAHKERAVSALRSARKGVRLKGVSLKDLIEEGRR